MEARSRALVDLPASRWYFGDQAKPFPDKHFVAQHFPEEPLDYRRVLLSCVIVCVAFAVALAASGLDPVAGTDAWCQDVYHLIAGKRYAPEHTLIVSLDDKALAAYPDTPLVFWGPLYAKALHRLKHYGVASVALDIHFGISISQSLAAIGTSQRVLTEFLDYDQPFDLALSEGRVILAANLIRDGAGVKARLPAPEYLAALPAGLQDVGLTTMLRDPDNTVRSFTGAYEPDGRQDQAAPDVPDPWLTFAALAVRQGYGGELPFFASPQSLFTNPPIAFCGPPGTIPRLSLADLLNQEELPAQVQQLLHGRVVFVGAEFEGAGDRQPTPYSRRLPGLGHRDMSNVEIHANIAESILAPGRLIKASPGTTILVWLPFFAAAAFLCDRLAPLRAVSGTLALFGAAWTTGLVFFHAGQLLPVAGLALGLVVINLEVSGLRLTRTERARERIRTIFSRYVSKEVLQRLLKQESLPVLGGEKYVVTVLFSDIRDFTTLSEQMTPGEVVEMLNAYFSQVCQAVERHGGMVDKFIGDAVMALFGAPVPCAAHPRQAIAAALEIKAIAERFQETMARLFVRPETLPFQIGVGLHTGPVVMGNIGSPGRMDYTATGDTVNTASRLESLTKTMGCTILASRNTTDAAGPDVLTGETSTQYVKGKREPVRVCSVLGLKQQEE